ncbi:MAG: hypothetical protein ACK5LS_11055 [Propioniciclava sp.]
MSASAGPRAAPSRVLVAAGAIIIVATYLYLVIGQPVEAAASASSRASLIAMAGYLLGAVLLAGGSIHRLPTSTIAMVPGAIAVNIVVGQLTAVLGLPLYLDSIGTVLVAALAGPAAGIVTGILTNVIWGLTLSPIALPFAVVQVIIGLLAGLAARAGMFRAIWRAPAAGAITGLVTAIIAAPVAAFVFGGATGGGAGAVVGAFQAMGQSLLAATTLQGLLSDPLDKLITFTVVGFLLATLPRRFGQRFWFARRYRVLGPGSSHAPTEAED